MSERHVSENEDFPFDKKVVEDFGDTPGNDRCVKLECGHTVLVSLPRDSGGGPLGSWVGYIEYCYSCDRLSEVESVEFHGPPDGCGGIVTRIPEGNSVRLSCAKCGSSFSLRIGKRSV